jgi:hypothetical protein
MKTTNRVFVLDKNKKPLMPCRAARARRLLKRGRAAVYRIEPFTIILKDRTYETSVLQPMSLKFGSLRFSVVNLRFQFNTK